MLGQASGQVSFSRRFYMILQSKMKDFQSKMEILQSKQI